MNLNKILQFVRSHGIKAWIAGDVIMAISVYTYQGATHEETCVVGRTLREAKLWLQY